MKISFSTTKNINQIITALLIILFFYTATSKLLDVKEFQRQLANQTLPGWSKIPLLWIIPVAELLLSLLLIIPTTRTTGFYGSSVLMLLFTGYIGLVLLNVFDRVPCSCSSLIRNMGFGAHFLFNLFFLTVSIVGIYMSNQQKKGGSVAASGL